MAKMHFSASFSPYKTNKGKHELLSSVTKDDSGNPRRYLCGLSSGIKLDGHGERMTEKAIKSFMDQANSGTILLYPDVHGIKASQDIGILTKCEITPEGDWYTEYRLYDEQDGVAQANRETADMLWKQVKGITPYTKPMAKGFSIEGNIPDEGIVSAETDSNGIVKHRIIDDVELEGVVLVPKPAYQYSVARAVYKALGEIHPDSAQRLRKSVASNLEAKIKRDEACNTYWEGKWRLQEAFEDEVRRIAQQPDTASSALDVALEEYAKLLKDLILNSLPAFTEGSTEVEQVNPYQASEGENAKIALYQKMLEEVERLESILQKRAN